MEWDAVELPSQFMENWCLDRATLMGMARHWQTGEPLPEEEFIKLRRNRTFTLAWPRCGRCTCPHRSAPPQPLDSELRHAGSVTP